MQVPGSWWRWLLFAIVVVAVVRIAATYRVFSQTIDEPTHVVAGFEWLTTGTYALDPEHPPLARILFAAGAVLEGAEWREELPRVARGTELLYRDGRYRHNLFLARIGNLPYFLLGLFAVMAWGRRLFGDAAGLTAGALYSALPPILAHAGLATTDMAAAATVVFALWALDGWLAERTWKRAALLGAAIGLGLISKYSFVIYFPAGALALLVANANVGRASARRPRGGRAEARPTFRQLLVIGFLPVLFVWAGYKFDTGTLNETRLKVLPPESLRYQAARFASFEGYDWVRPDLVIRYYDYAHAAANRGAVGVDFVDWAKAAGYPSPQAGRSGRDTTANGGPLPRPSLLDRVQEPFLRAWQSVVVHVPLPAPYWIAGAEYVAQHSEAGHPAFLLGEHRPEGWWYYFPVLLFYKTPLAFLLLALGGMVLLRRRALAWVPLVMLLPALTSKINIGVRHVLPLYPVLAIVAGYAAVVLWKKSRVATVVLAGWFFVAGALAHPDYLPYFHELARHPEEIATDSNLDWGQDLLRLEREVRERRIGHLYLSYFGSADWRRHAIPAEELPRDRRVRGWVAISEMQLKFGNPEDFAWLGQYRPVARVGKSIRLYRIP
ncbi:MAG TPA: glycosyltransferase family 39 protein [Thermoanaerobaculia bacterium]|nr:glycosyltransferase family 39 protein [Thermoanaerobaculia bacterium]